MAGGKAGVRQLDANGKSGLFRRYERWNPVHPTSGAFWGMGFGIGCGVGWGPGFGPEVIGYVGAGCGIGFSVGITLVGVGIGLPANFLLQIPCKVVEGARTGALEFCKSSAVSVRRNENGFDWNPMNPFLSGLTKVAYGKHPNVSLPRFTSGFQLNEMKIHLTNQAKSCLIRLGAFKDSFLTRDKGEKGDPPP